MGQITIRLSDKIEEKLKREARDNKKTLAEYCREKIAGDSAVSSLEELNPITIENRIEGLENQLRLMDNVLTFHTRFLYRFAKIASSDEKDADDAWNETVAEAELKKRSK